jgi:hypothetical protein
MNRLRWATPPAIVFILALILTACDSAPATPSPMPSIQATAFVARQPTPSALSTSAATTAPTHNILSPTATPTSLSTDVVKMGNITGLLPASPPEPPLVPALPLTATLAQAYPLRLGAQWVYSVTTVSGMPGHLVTMTGLLTHTVVDTNVQNGLHVFRIWSEQDNSLAGFPNNEPIQYYVLSADTAYWWNSDHPELLIASRGRKGAEVLPWPLEVGQQFSPIGLLPHTDGTYAWNVLSREQVSTPVGRFTDCFHLLFRTNPDDTHDWFCPGTGFVRREYHHHGSIGDIVQVLVGYNYVTVPDRHITDAAIKAARLRLSQNGHADPALAAVILVTPTIWLDDCLGLPANGVCHRTRTPGYLIELEKDQQRYLFRTDAFGRLIRLAWSSMPPLRDALVQWRYHDGAQCEVAAIGDDHIQYGVCGEALFTTSQPLSSKHYGLGQASDFRQRYRSFVAYTSRGTLIFTGTGTQKASDAEQRAIAEWAATRYTEANYGYLSADEGLKLYWHERTASLCGTLWIYQDGLAVAWDCAGAHIIGEAILTQLELARFYKWLDSGKHWNIEHIPSTGDGQPDATLVLPSNATGGSATQQDAEGMLPFARAIYTRLTTDAAEKTKAQKPAVVEGRLTVQDGRVFQYRLPIPYDWAGKYAVREEGNLVFFDYDANPQSTLFVIAAFTEAQWQDEQKPPRHSEQLTSQDGVIFTYNTPLANPYSAGNQQDEFQRMGGQIRAIVSSLKVTVPGS